MREITLEVPDGVKRVSAIVKYKTKDQADNQISVATFSFDTDMSFMYGLLKSFAIVFDDTHICFTSPFSYASTGVRR